MPVEKTPPGTLTNYQLLDVGDRFIPLCFEQEGLKFRKDAFGTGFVGVCIADSTRSQSFAECAPVYKLENKPAEVAPATAGETSTESDGATAEGDQTTPETPAPEPVPTKSKKS